MSDVIRCRADGCSATIPNHKFGKIKSGWFEQKDGTVWCPKHTPAWVAAWRAKKGQS